MDIRDGYFKVGGVQYPLQTGLTGSILKKQDPTTFYLLDYLSTLITANANAAWQEAQITASLPNCPNIIGYRTGTNPVPHLKDASIKFPLFAIYNTTGKTVSRSISYQSTQSTYEILYLMPPLALHQEEILKPFLETVFDIIKDRSQVRADPNYQNGLLWQKAAGIEEILSFVNYDKVSVPGKTESSLPFIGILITMQVREMNDVVDPQFEYEPVDKLTADLDLLNPEETIEDFVQIQVPTGV